MAQLQQASPLIIIVSITMSANRTLPYTGIVSNVSIQVSQNDRGFVCVNPSQGITDFVHELRVQCTLVWTVYVYKTK